MLLLTIASLVIIALAITMFKIIKTKTPSFITVVVLIFLLFGLGIIGYVSYGLFDLFVTLPNQGKLVNVLSDTAWVTDELELIFLQGRSLYSITIRGTDKRKISDIVDDYALSPDREKVALWYRVLQADLYEKTMMGITIVDIRRNTNKVIEKYRNCSSKLVWLADSSGIAYSSDNDYKICFYKIGDGIRKVIDVPRKVYGLAVTKDKSKLAYASLFDKKYYLYDFGSQAISEISAGTPYAVDLGKDIDRNFWKGVRNVPLKTSDGSIELYNLKGSLWLKRNDQKELLVEYAGRHDDKLASGVQPLALSYNAQYAAFSFKGKIYICDTLSKKSGYLADGHSAEFLNVPKAEKSPQ
jgi:hypothetical protein